MSELIAFDAGKLFTVNLSIPEILVRSFLLYCGLCLLLRVLPKRQVGKASTTDLLFVILMGSFTADGISKDATSVTDYVIVILVVLGLTYAFDWMSSRSQWFRFLVLEPPTVLIRNGKIQWANLRRELLTEDDLMRELRRQNLDDPSQVRKAQLEADGEISIIKD